MTFEEQHAKNLRILKLIREDHGWALSRILLAEKLEAELDNLEISRAAAIAQRDRYRQKVETLEVERDALQFEAVMARKAVDANSVERWKSMETKRAQRLEAELIALREALRDCKVIAETATVDEPVGVLPNKIAARVTAALRRSPE